MLPVSLDCPFLVVAFLVFSNGKTVMVFIHGGDFTSMSGGAPAFNGEHFANKGDVILVTFNYRLGRFVLF
jgi:carboxylesterase type B